MGEPTKYRLSLFFLYISLFPDRTIAVTEIQPDTAIMLITEQTVIDRQSLPDGVSNILKEPMHVDHMLSVSANALDLT